MFAIVIDNDRQQVEHTHKSGPVMVGRAPNQTFRGIVIQDRYVSREHVLLEEVTEGRLSIHVTGSSAVALDDGGSLEPGQDCVRTLPVAMVLGYTQLKIHPVYRDPPTEPVPGLATISRPIHTAKEQGPVKQFDETTDAETIAQWLERLVAVQKAAAGSERFYHETARAVVELVGLDRGLIVLREANNWRTVATCSRINDDDSSYSQTVLNQLLKQRRTFFESSLHRPGVASLARVDAYVASPIFDAQNDIVGVVFGSRDLRIESPTEGIRPLEAQFVQVLAGAVSAGLARLDQEAEAARLQVQLERFASAKIASELKRNPSLLDPQTREISVIFADIRRFSSIAEKVGADLAYCLIREVMDRMTSCIMQSDGLIIDYAGDGLAAMWNAPSDQPKHHLLACQTAIAMQSAMTQLDLLWKEKIGDSLEMGIGIHSGLAQVGNSGSRWRMKYSPIGHTVNLASRIEGATKPLGVSILMTAATKLATPESAHLTTRRIGPIRVLGIRQPVEVYQLATKEREPSPELWLLYQKALEHFQHGRFDESAKSIDLAVSFSPDDGPSQLLRQRVQNILASNDNKADTVWDLDAK